jgi:hypothetical protein
VLFTGKSTVKGAQKLIVLPGEEIPPDGLLPLKKK